MKRGGRGVSSDMAQDIRNIGRAGQSWRERIKSHVRELRQRQTKSEEIIWELVRNRKLDGKKFLRQHPFLIIRLQMQNEKCKTVHCP